MARPSSTSVILVLALGAGAIGAASCTLDLSGRLAVDAGSGDATAGPDAADATLPPDGATDDAGDEAATDAPPPPRDSGKDAGNDCGAALGAAGSANAFPSLGAKVIDGVLDDWGCEAPLPLTQATAAYVKQPDGGTVVVSAKVRWEYDAAHLYFAAEVTDPLLQGDAGDSTVNDSVEMYGASDAGPLSGIYRQGDHHYVWDYKGLVQDWGPPSPVTSPPGVTSKVTVNATGYTVEASILPTAFNRTNYRAGDLMSVDLELNDADGTRQNSALVWQLSPNPTPCPCNEPACCCGLSDDLPFCDTTRFGTLTLR
jgi:Carbohydrate family 9 binding domain-like